MIDCRPFSEVWDVSGMTNKPLNPGKNADGEQYKSSGLSNHSSITLKWMLEKVQSKQQLSWVNLYEETKERWREGNVNQSYLYLQHCDCSSSSSVLLILELKYVSKQLIMYLNHVCGCQPWNVTLSKSMKLFCYSSIWVCYFFCYLRLNYIKKNKNMSCFSDIIKYSGLKI